jgi:hypothetical protein
VKFLQLVILVGIVISFLSAQNFMTACSTVTSSKTLNTCAVVLSRLSMQLNDTKFPLESAR